MIEFSQIQVHCTPGGEDRLEDSVLAQNKISGFLRRWGLRVHCKTRPIHSMRVCRLVLVTSCLRLAFSINSGISLLFSKLFLFIIVISFFF